ncbi:MAG: hypothetical protein Nkreftii_000051 [Candidatus Nitrospira kreftii]|uniref:Serine protease n=1 Tax=Candidatus Nitrospira kreftii TaxID=2652173 RepID=A0A7S8FAM6_9BACT|nr:MAG: hypothetical protein Nkreftii_000051 [Candidatus Nitrospira kreftii]
MYHRVALQVRLPPQPMALLVTVLLILSFTSPTLAERLDSCQFSAKVVTEFGSRIRKPMGTKIDYGRRNHPIATNDVPLDHVRVLVKLNNKKVTNWHLALYDERDQLIQSFVPEDFDKDVTALWSNRIKGNVITTILAGTRGLGPSRGDPQLSIESVLIMPKEALRTYHSRKDLRAPDDEWKDIETSDLFYQQLGEGTGIMLMGHNKNSWICSGIAITEHLFLTNWHCGGLPDMVAESYWQPSIYSNAIIDLAWDQSTRLSEFRVVQVEAKSEDRDYAILRIAPISSSYLPRPAALAARVIATEETVLIHHPEGRKKQVSSGPTCHIRNPVHTGTTNAPIDFSHSCDTEGGSSGAPVFDRDGYLVGIHHLGHQRTEAGDCDKTNKAVHLSAILADLRHDKSAKIAKKKLNLLREMNAGSLTTPRDTFTP